MDAAFMKAGNLARRYTLRKKGSSQYYLVQGVKQTEVEWTLYIQALYDNISEL